MAAGNRPLSPHLLIYRPQLTSVLSIFHRFTGVVLSAGLLLLVYWLAALAAGDAAYTAALGVLGAWPVKILLFLFSYAFFYHLCNGLRHLWWDTGRGFEIPQIYASGWVVVVASLALTSLTWAVLLLGGGA
jgi:succinate dehydrogenase / fumarate reductase, cytochrome b subunit